MRLLIDIGNTRIKWMCMAADQPIPSQQFSHAFTHQQNFIDAFEACFGVSSEFEQQLFDSPPTTIVVSNVAGESASQALTAFSESVWQLKPLYIEVTRELAGIYNDYEVLSELGVDRWIAIIGARQYFSASAVILINCGTAITVDVLSEDDHFLGGTILPGFQLAANALSQADGIANIQPATIQNAIGTSTQECVQLGIIAACVGGVESAVDKIQVQLQSQDLKILLSGGGAPLFLDASNLECEYDANVIMRGLNRVIECEF